MYDKGIRWADVIVLFVYFFFTCFFFLERTSFLDNPFTLFKLINDGSPFVNANRYPAAIMQFLPLLGIKLGLPLKGVMFLHSLGYFLFHSILFCLIRYIIKDKEISWLLLLSLIIPVAHTFFWNNNELFLGLSGLCLWLALMRRGYFYISIALAMILAWVHPLLVVIALFILATKLASSHISKNILLTNVFLYGVSYFIKAKFFPNYYDTGKNELLLKNLSEYDFSLVSIFELISSVHFWPIILSCLMALILVLMQRRWILAILLAGFYLCYLILTDLTEGNPFYVFYNEGNFRVLFFVAAYTLIISEVYKKYNWLKYLLGAMLIVGFVRIGLKSSFYTNRIEWYQQISTDHDRQVLSYGEDTKQQLIQSWASPFESIVLSTLDGASKTMIFSENSKVLAEEMKTNRQMITTHGKFLVYNPKNGYFNLADKTYSSIHLK